MNILGQLEDEEQVYGINHGTGPEQTRYEAGCIMAEVRASSLSAYLANRPYDFRRETTPRALQAAFASIDAKFAKPIERKEAA